MRIIVAVIRLPNPAHTTTKFSQAEGQDVRVYALKGGLFFAAIEPFANIFTPSKDPERIAIDFSDSAIIDFSAVNSINGVAKR